MTDSTENATPPKSTNQKHAFARYLAVQIPIEIWSDLDLYQIIWVLRFSGFRGYFQWNLSCTQFLFHRCAFQVESVIYTDSLSSIPFHILVPWGLDVRQQFRLSGLFASWSLCRSFFIYSLVSSIDLFSHSFVSFGSSCATAITGVRFVRELISL